MAAVGRFGCPKFTFDRISGHFRSKRFKMAAGAHIGCPKFTFYRISGHFRSICNFNFLGNFWYNVCRRPFWISVIHFRSHFWPFQIDTQQLNFLGKFLRKWLPSINTEFFVVEIFDKMAGGRHLECSKITFNGISGHFRSFGHFGCLKFTFDSNYVNFRSIQIFFPIHTERNFFFEKMAAGGHFGWDDNVNYQTHLRYLDE